MSPDFASFQTEKYWIRWDFFISLTVIILVKNHIKRWSSLMSISQKWNQNYREISPHTSQSGHHPKFTNNKWWRDCREKGTLYTVGGNVRWCNHYKTQYGVSLENHLSYDPAIPILGIIYWKDKNYRPKRHMYPNVQCNTIYNIQNVKAP